MARSTRLPAARLISNEPTEAQVRWVLRLVLLMFVAYAFVMVFGHIPKS